MEFEEGKYISELKKTFNSYSPISEESWLQIRSILQFQSVKKGEMVLRAGQTAKNMHFICKGVLRTFYSDAQGNVYTKNLFFENSFPASTVSLLQNAPSNFSIEALEDSILINFRFEDYKRLISEKNDLKDFYIAYIEQNWIIEKEQKEISLVMENASERYVKLLQKYPEIEKQISQQHLASHLGITPTQLSRIRKALKK